MAPKKVISEAAKARAQTRVKAKAFASAYVGAEAPPAPWVGTTDDYITQMVATEDVLSSVAMSSTETIQNIIPALSDKIAKQTEVLNACQMIVKTRELALQKQQKPQVEKPTKMEKYKGKMVIFVNTPSGQRIKIAVSRAKSLAFFKERVGEKTKEFGSSSSMFKSIAIVKNSKFLNNHPRGMIVNMLEDGCEVDVMWYDDLPDDAFPDGEEMAPNDTDALTSDEESEENIDEQ
ncbi:unnamed protein product [Effrenium voratum]|uniref:Uncharacterized protein n=1 Tax=Effrenium voratum TaxID=2562239 RepID=A0AA36IN04_9DINO|nr:unnamed protein product [Effrenium voratum]CAJ1389682.1 unnamed protein product [Effrenium voratum]